MPLLQAPSKANLDASASSIPIVMAGAMLMTLATEVQIPIRLMPMTLHILAITALLWPLSPIATPIKLAYLVPSVAVLPVFSGSPGQAGSGCV